MGSNGAGKTTLLNTIAGLNRARRGTIEFDGVRIEKEPAHRIFAHGFALVPQGRQLFPAMTVRENLELGASQLRGVTDLDERTDKVLALFPRLKERFENAAGGLSGGEQQMLATGRALMSKPKLLLLDEPTTGLAPRVVSELIGILLALKESGQSMLVVEQNVSMALAVSDKVYMMRMGTVTSAPDTIRTAAPDEIFKQYLQ